jgi:sugar/nucleoside kinase (ribokinase family)
LRLVSKSPNLYFNNFPSDYLHQELDGIILCPLCNEIDIEYIKSLKKNLKDCYIAIDIQGFIRKIDDNGHILLRSDDEFKQEVAYIIDILDDMLILKGSEEEMYALSGISNPIEAIKNLATNNSLIITTLGTNGSLIKKRGKEIIKIPAFKSDGVVDETGAGDAYMSIFLYEFINSSKDWDAIKKSGYYASAAASFLVESKGPKGFQPKEKILERIRNQNYIE